MNIFGRINELGNVDVLDHDGCPVCSLPDSLPTVYPVGSSLGASYPHDGIELTLADARRIGIDIEDEPKAIICANTKCFAEFKTHNKKSFDDVEKHGVKKSKPVHFSQMQIYCHLCGFTRWAWHHCRI